MSKLSFAAIGLAIAVIGCSGTPDPIDKLRNEGVVGEALIDSAIRWMSSSDSLIKLDGVALAEAMLGTGESPASKVVPILTGLLQEDPSLTVRLSAVGALGASEDPTAADGLLRASRNEDAASLLRMKALQEVARMNLRNREIMLVASENVAADELLMRHVSIDILSTSKEREFLGKLVKTFQKHIQRPEKYLLEVPPIGWHTPALFRNAYEELSWHLTASLDSVGILTPDLLVPLFNLGNGTLREAAVSSSVPGLLTWLEPDQPWRSRLFAIQALESSGDERAFGPMLKMAEDDSLRWNLREGALDYVIRRDKKRFRWRLSQLLWRIVEDRQAHPALRAKAMDELSKMGCGKRKLLRIASENLESMDLLVRYSSLRILAGSEDIGDLRKLIWAYVKHHEAPDSILKATRPWLVTCPPFFDNAYEETSSHLREHISAIARTNPELLDPILDHTNAELVLSVAKCFQGTQDNRPVPGLVHILKTSENWKHRFEAVGLLNKVYLGDRREMAVSALKHALGDDHSEEKPEGQHRPVAGRAYLVLRDLGVEVDKPDNVILIPNRPSRIIME